MLTQKPKQKIKPFIGESIEGDNSNSSEDDSNKSVESKDSNSSCFESSDSDICSSSDESSKEDED